jgi:hypothetical protein
MLTIDVATPSSSAFVPPPIAVVIIFVERLTQITH